MKIAYISNSIIPSQKANSVHVMKMCNALAKNNIETILFCGGANQNENVVFSKYGIGNHFKLNRISQSKFLKNIIPNSFYIALKTYMKLVSKKNEMKKVDYLYGRSVYGLYLLRNKYKFIYESHMPPREGLLRFLEKRLLKNKNCLYLVVISNALKDRYLELFPWLDYDKIIVMHDAADEVPDIIGSENKTNLFYQSKQDDNVIIGYLGHLYFGKCMEIVLELANKRSNYMFHIVGGTDYWVNYWIKKIKILNLNNIKLYGYVDNSEIGDYYRCFDICLLPFSRNIFFDKKKKDDIGSWISPLKLFEAMSYGKAILASKLPTIEEVLTDNYDSLLSDPDNVDEWCRKLDVLVESKITREKLGENALNNLKKSYTWDIRAKKIIKLLESRSNCDN